mgnify:CR=1 FL=1
MEIIEILNEEKYLKEYIGLCYLEWSSKSMALEKYIEYKFKSIKTDDNVISVLGLINDKKLIGFISLFKIDGDERKDLSPWQFTMYVKKEYRKKGYSKLLNDALLKKTKSLGFVKVYLKSNLVNYYERFGAIFIEKLNNEESLFYINL